MYITQKIADETLLKVKSEIEQLSIQVGKIKPSVKLTSNKTLLGTCNKIKDNILHLLSRVLCLNKLPSKIT